MEIRGVMPALVTPFAKNLEIDEDGFRNNIEFLIEGGVHGIVPGGTTGEAATLSHTEHKKVIDIAVDAADGQVPVVAGTGSNNTTEALDLTKHAESAGADAAMIITPYYNKPTDRGMYEHYKTLAEAVDIPIIMYNVPSRTGINLKPEVAASLVKDFDNIVGVKEASGDLVQIAQIIELAGEKVRVMSGSDELTFPILALGGVGAISVVGNIAPGKVAEMIESFEKGDIGRARKIHYELLPLIRALFIETNPIPVKTAMNMMGLAAGVFRKPLALMSDENKEILKTELKRVGLL